MLPVLGKRGTAAELDTHQKFSKIKDRAFVRGCRRLRVCGGLIYLMHADRCRRDGLQESVNSGIPLLGQMRELEIRLQW